MVKYTKAELEDMDIWTLEELCGEKGLTKAQMIAKLAKKESV